MSDELAERYEAVPYQHGAIAETHPARLGAIGRLHGLATAPPDRCRVLELGCGECLNLLPLAERLPSSAFVGVDFSPSAIARGEALRVAGGLGNVRLLCADLRNWEPEGEFDYIIAHGLYSWVPPEVRERLLSLCARFLAPGGLAYLSYNLLPGWSLPGGVRAVLLGEVAGLSKPAAKIDRARQVLQAWGKSLEGQAGAYPAHLREVVSDMLQKPPGLFFHDDLAPINDPCTFTDFMAHASRHGLHYVAEAHYAATAFANVPGPMRAALGELGLDLMQEQQGMDVLFQRWLRNSILARAQPPVQTGGAWEALRATAVGLRAGFSVRPAAPAEGAPWELAGPRGVVATTVEASAKALLAALAQVAPERLPFAALLAKACEIMTPHALAAAPTEALAQDFFGQLLALDAVDLLLAGGGDWLRLSPAPAPSPLMKLTAARGWPVTNRWHEPVGLTEAGRHWLAGDHHDGNPAALEAGLLV